MIGNILRRKSFLDYSGPERRKHKRFKVALPVKIRVIDPKTGKLKRREFDGLVTDISMGGLGLEMKYPGSDLLSFAPKLVGKNKQFDLNVDVKLETGDVRGVAEVRWARIPPLTGLGILTMGLFLKRMARHAKRKWTDFVTNRNKQAPGNREKPGERRVTSSSGRSRAIRIPGQQIRKTGRRD